MTKSKGFTLLEAIVSLSILSSALVASYGWYSTITIGLIRAQERMEVLQFSKNFDSYLSTTNLVEETAGKYSSNGIYANWTSRLVEEKKDGTTLVGGLGDYRFGLYEVTAEVFFDESETSVDTISTRLVGYEAVRGQRFGVAGP